MPHTIKLAAALVICSLGAAARADDVADHQCCTTFDAGPSSCHDDDGTYGESASDQHRKAIAEARQERCLKHEAAKAAKVQAADKRWCAKHHPDCGGGTLLDGIPCTDNSQCSSGACGVNGSGNCCSSPCSTADATCGAIGCDDSGACQYPDSNTACSAGSCSGSTLTQSSCDGAGNCGAPTSAPCPGNFACLSSTSCFTACNFPSNCASGFHCVPDFQQCLPPAQTGDRCLQDSDCVDGDYCNGGVLGEDTFGTCTVRATSGGPCSDNSQCPSGVCIGNCCSTACDTSDPVCGASSCDDTGACVYPDTSVICFGEACYGTTDHHYLCSGGQCTDFSGPCAGNLTCGAPSDNNGACWTSCTDDTQCVSGFHCDAGACN
jgi:hypothetical protein